MRIYGFNLISELYEWNDENEWNGMEYKKMLFISIFCSSIPHTLHYIQHTLHYISNEMMYIERINNNIQMFDFQCYTHVSVMFVLLF